MNIWTCVLGWFRFTVPDSTADEVIARVGGEWIKDKKGFLGYRQGWLSRGNSGGLGRIGTGASWAPREVHVDLSQELISDWTYQKFHDEPSSHRYRSGLIHQQAHGTTTLAGILKSLFYP